MADLNPALGERRRPLCCSITPSALDKLVNGPAADGSRPWQAILFIPGAR
ncbi:hypothetical protein ACLAIF_12735 [Klebsiella pneumoniae]